MSKSAAIKRRGENSNNEGGSDTATAPLVKKRCIETAAANDEGPHITTCTRSISSSLLMQQTAGTQNPDSVLQQTVETQNTDSVLQQAAGIPNPNQTRNQNSVDVDMEVEQTMNPNSVDVDMEVEQTMNPNSVDVDTEVEETRNRNSVDVKMQVEEDDDIALIEYPVLRYSPACVLLRPVPGANTHPDYILKY